MQPFILRLHYRYAQDERSCLRAAFLPFVLSVGAHAPKSKDELALKVQHAQQ
jgi:hypothetical protein